MNKTLKLTSQTKPNRASPGQSEPNRAKMSQACNHKPPTFRFLHLTVGILTLLAVHIGPCMTVPFNPFHPSEENDFQNGSYPIDLTWNDVRTSLLTRLLKFCEAKRVCNTTGFEHLVYEHACSVCDKCYCDEACFRMGDCCLDKQLDLLGNQLIQRTSETISRRRNYIHDVECVDTRFKDEKLLVGDDETLQHRMITFCPLLYKNIGVKLACEVSGHLNDDILSFKQSITDLMKNRPVASVKTKLFYKNKACALCNGENEVHLKDWNLQISCDNDNDLLHSMNETKVLQFVLPSRTCGKVAFTVPEGFKPRTCDVIEVIASSSSLSNDIVVLSPPILFVCNETGIITAYDAVLRKSCSVFSGIVSEDKEVPFANVFCFDCQYYGRSIRRQPCLREIGFPFVIVLDPQALRQAKQTSTECGCDVDEVYDNTKKACRQLNCPTKKHLRNGICDDTSLSTLGLKYAITLKLTATIKEEEKSNSVEGIHYPNELASEKNLAQTLFDQFNILIFGNNAVMFKTFLVYGIRTDLFTDDSFDVYIFAQFELRVVANPRSLEKKLAALDSSDISFKAEDEGMTFDFKARYAPKPSRHVFDASRQTPENFDVRNGRFTKDPGPTLFAYDNVLSTSAHFYEPEDNVDANYTEVKRVLSCPRIGLDLSKEIDFVLFNESNAFAFEQSVVHVPSDIKWSFFEMEMVGHKQVVFVCADKLTKYYSSIQEEDEINSFSSIINAFGLGPIVTSYICLGLSALTLSLTLLTYILFPHLRTVPGKATVGFVSMLFITIILFQVGGFLTDFPEMCEAVGIATHFFLMSAFTWMVICTAHMFYVFSKNLEQKSSDNSKIRLVIYYAASLGVPALIVTATILGNLAGTNLETGRDTVDDDLDTSYLRLSPMKCGTRDTRTGYGAGICYLSNKTSLLLAGVAPIILACFINLFLYIRTAMAFRYMTSQQTMVRKDANNEIKTYVKLSTLTGINWLPAMLCAFISTPVLWYFFLVLCGLQGVYVFWAFVLNRRVRNLYGQLFKRERTGNMTQNISESRPRIVEQRIVSDNTNSSSLRSGNSSESSTDKNRNVEQFER